MYNGTFSALRRVHEKICSIRLKRTCGILAPNTYTVCHLATCDGIVCSHANVPCDPWIVVEGFWFGESSGVFFFLVDVVDLWNPRQD